MYPAAPVIRRLARPGLSGHISNMESWFEIVVRQLFLYSLPLLLSLGAVGMMEATVTGKQVPGPFHTVSWRGTWWPLLASAAFHRGIIIALPRPVGGDLRSVKVRFLAHLLLCLLGLLLYVWSIAAQSPVGLPPLHFWWAKLLMFFNLCMVCLHLLPLPGLLAGQLLAGTKPGTALFAHISENRGIAILTLLAASPLLDLLLGSLLIFPAYEAMNNLAANLSGNR